MAFHAIQSPDSNPLLAQTRVESGVPEIVVAGDVDQTSLPLILDEIRHAVGLFTDILDRHGDQLRTARHVSVDLTDTDRLEAQAVEQLMALVLELEADRVTVGIVHRQ
jgi:hypothetical protein